MFKFKKEEIKTESKHATTPQYDEAPKKKTPLSKIKIFFFVWNVISIAVYSAYTLFVVYEMAEKTFLAKVIQYLLILYAVVFVILIILSFFDKKQASSRLKNYKSAISFFKAFVQIINFVLSMITIISVFIATGKPDFKGFLFAILSLVLTLASILFEVVKIIIRKNIGIIKQNFLDLRDKPKKHTKKESE